MNFKKNIASYPSPEGYIAKKLKQNKTQCRTVLCCALLSSALICSLLLYAVLSGGSGGVAAAINW